jgi:hypothetical protein
MPEYTEGFDVDHIDRNRANNTLANLRWVSRSVNNRNKSKRAGTSSEFAGVSRNKAVRKWQASIRIDGVQKHLGLFDDEEEAAEAYQSALLEVEPPVERLDPILSMEIAETLTIQGVQYVIMEHRQEPEDEMVAEPVPVIPTLKPKRKRVIYISEPDTESNVESGSDSCRCSMMTVPDPAGPPSAPADAPSLDA